MTRRKVICPTFVFVFLLASVVMAQEVPLSVPEQVQFAKALLPGVKKVAVITTMKETENELKQLVVAGKTYSVTFDIYDVPTVAQTREAFQLASNSRPHLIWLLNDNITNQSFGRRLILERSLSLKIPVYSWSKEFLREGALFAFEKDASGNVVTFFNSRIGDMLGVQVPTSFTTTVTRIAQ